MRRALIAVGLFAVVLTACETSPLGRRQLQFFPDDQVAEMGVASYQQLKEQQPVDDNPQINSYVSCVALAITEQLDPSDQQDWEVTVFEDESANAFALPGGKIGVHSGLLRVAETPSQLATVIGHEVAHVLAEHSNERLSTAYATNAGLQLIQVLAGERMGQQQEIMALLGLGAQVGIILPFSRTQESEADVLGLELMARAGFNPRESVTLWQNMGAAAGAGAPPEFLSTHPSHGTRIENLQAQIPKAMRYYEQAVAAGRRPKCQ